MNSGLYHSEASPLYQQPARKQLLNLELPPIQVLKVPTLILRDEHAHTQDCKLPTTHIDMDNCYRLFINSCRLFLSHIWWV